MRPALKRWNKGKFMIEPNQILCYIKWQSRSWGICRKSYAAMKSLLLKGKKPIKRFYKDCTEMGRHSIWPPKRICVKLNQYVRSIIHQLLTISQIFWSCPTITYWTEGFLRDILNSQKTVSSFSMKPTIFFRLLLMECPFRLQSPSILRLYKILILWIRK